MQLILEENSLLLNSISDPVWILDGKMLQYIAPFLIPKAVFFFRCNGVTKYNSSMSQRMIDKFRTSK